MMWIGPSLGPPVLNGYSGALYSNPFISLRSTAFLPLFPVPSANSNSQWKERFWIKYKYLLSKLPFFFAWITKLTSAQLLQQLASNAELGKSTPPSMSFSLISIPKSFCPEADEPSGNQFLLFLMPPLQSTCPAKKFWFPPSHTALHLGFPAPLLL